MTKITEEPPRFEYVQRDDELWVHRFSDDVMIPAGNIDHPAYQEFLLRELEFFSQLEEAEFGDVDTHLIGVARLKEHLLPITDAFVERLFKQIEKHVRHYGANFKVISYGQYLNHTHRELVPKE